MFDRTKIQNVFHLTKFILKKFQLCLKILKPLTTLLEIVLVKFAACKIKSHVIGCYSAALGSKMAVEDGVALFGVVV